ncbi:MAG: phosphoribosylformylglycinamidine cyclo-ligase [Deltaproteobacteria bacterium GWA2_38_16]|nr:MAG: phosphoribosylformylglycinamidine cyclo-ligase [Deltaproteobacteria bacterium GWA2_38_16]OGQ03175.1 MAG: phosphoribosylformylglycinamidine cyclo-ligase [Deltaproteobacteria bacterium RIFCSPHIGHO2_02_FULL_38_15]OGQ33769.1 MAG: phosphoribosylformylglycinamidine cyclo-ligase [Deltaproteobacteria bacterium RIFCSPLOWO2_01_FULL_38_9]HBQ20401.1 phosphoribosylformylglycinamidine cyclo-ligase [Deltaproteobacteria bacterium]
MEASHYKKSGVDITRADEFIEKIKPLAKSTYRKDVLAGLGGFAALVQANFKKYKNPILVSGTDGVGTKLKIAFMANRHKTVGIDLVAMSVNDVLTTGAEPLFFLDYFATAKLDMNVAKDVIEGIAEGCRISHCSLIGGETAEMPGFYHPKEYDLAGFAVGIVEKNKIVDGSKIKPGHVLIGLASSGLHSNGYSLVRKIMFEDLKLSPNDHIKEIGTVADVLLTPTVIYVPLVLKLLKQFSIHGMVHITGGGFTENIPRVLPKGVSARIQKGSWPIPPIFDFLKTKGNISQEEMFKTFNCGIGYILIVPEKESQKILKTLHAQNQKAYGIGEVISKRRKDDNDPNVVYI